jgi:hypothetical protein
MEKRRRRDNTMEKRRDNTMEWILLSCCSSGIVCSGHGFSCHVVVVVLFVVFMDSPVML